MCKTEPQAVGQLVERATKNHRNNAKLCLGRHADRPRHHVLVGSFTGQHVPGVHQHGRAFRSRVLQKCDEPFVIEIPFADVITDLYTDMSVLHRPR